MAAFRRASMGFVFQAINLVPTLTLFENVALPGYLASHDRKGVDARVLSLLQSMGLDEQARRVPSRVSGGSSSGQPSRGRSSTHPRFSSRDEPTGNLDSANGAQVLDILSGLAAGGQTILMVTYDIKAACRAGWACLPAR